jgi:hypothetical protein
MLHTNSIGSASVRGLVGSMAMTGLRRVTRNLGLLEETPPNAIAARRAGRPLRRLSPERREVAIELAHWGYGAAGGAVFGMLPPRVRRQPAAGPAYGLGVWAFFELVLEPVLALDLPRRRRVATRAMLVLDHLLYGAVVGGRLSAEHGLPRARPEVATARESLPAAVAAP